MNVGFIVGSLRKESWNRKVAEVTQELFPKDIETGFIDIVNLPLYNEDLDGENVNEEYKRVREEVKKYDAYIFFTPEYNRAVAPAAKNVIDVVSKDPEGNLWASKPVAVFSASMGGYGAMAGNQTLRQAFLFVDLIAMQKPEVYLQNVADLFDENGEMVKDTREFLQGAVDAFIAHVKRLGVE